MEIDITGVDLRKFVADVYDLSVPQGMGFLHARPGDLPDEVIDNILKNTPPAIAVSMDYVLGRACKMTVYRKEGALLIGAKWFDHSQEQLNELLRRHGITATSSAA